MYLHYYNVVPTSVQFCHCCASAYYYCHIYTFTIYITLYYIIIKAQILKNNKQLKEDIIILKKQKEVYLFF